MDGEDDSDDALLESNAPSYTMVLSMDDGELGVVVAGESGVAGV